MAALDYHYPGGQQLGEPPPAPTYEPQQHLPRQQNSLDASSPYPVPDLPPPYTPYVEPPRLLSQPPPLLGPPHNHRYRQPQPRNGREPNHGYPPDNTSRAIPQVHDMCKPSDFGRSPHTLQPYQQPAPHAQLQHGQECFPLAGAPAIAQVYGNGNHGGRGSSTIPGYRPPGSPSRDDYNGDRSRPCSRNRNRSRHRKHHHDRQQVQRRKSSSGHTFIGAGGGALIGCAIFPGLGTLGGAILGGLVGHEYGKQKPESSPNRSRGRSYINKFDKRT